MSMENLEKRIAYLETALENTLTLIENLTQALSEVQARACKSITVEDLKKILEADALKGRPKF